MISFGVSAQSHATSCLTKDGMQALTAMDMPESLARTMWNIIQRMQPDSERKGGPVPLKPTSDLKYPGLAMPDTR